MYQKLTKYMYDPKGLKIRGPKGLIFIKFLSKILIFGTICTAEEFYNVVHLTLLYVLTPKQFLVKLINLVLNFTKHYAFGFTIN